MTRPDITAALSHHADEVETVYALEEIMDKNEIEIDGVRYVAVNPIYRNNCRGCIAINDHGLCNAIPDTGADCSAGLRKDSREVIWAKATD